MEAVAPYALPRKRIGQCKGLLDFGCRAVKRGVEACHLRQVGIEFQRHLDRREIVRLVQGGQRHQGVEFGQEFRRDQHRLGMAQPAMDDAVAERRQPPAAELLPRPREQCREQFARRRRRLTAELWRFDFRAVRALGARLGMHPDPIDLSGKKPFVALVNAELQR